ncbi:MAG: hypothetical protein JW857_01925 [Bacteroidales bacterium]|nr:hypothetical protein [Bacteroidales bacterium]
MNKCRNFLFLICLLLIGFISRAQTTRITNFDELMQSLNSGEQVRVVIQYGLCEWAPNQQKQSPTPDAITGMNIDVYEYFSPGLVNNKMAFVVFSNAKLIQNPIGKGFVYNYGKLRINADNSVQIKARYIHPKNLKVVMDETFIGEINDGTNKKGINLFK